MEETIFDKIIRGEVPCHKVYEDEHTLAFLDVYPKNEGHTLVIPKRGSVYVWDLEDDDYHAVMAASKKVALRLREVLPYQYVHQGIVGTDVPYAHVHVIPFETTDQLGTRQNFDEEPDHKKLATLAERLFFS